MGLSHAEIIMLQQAQDRAVQRQQSYQEQFVKFSELDDISTIIEHLRITGATIAYIGGVKAESMRRRFGAYRRTYNDTYASIEHAFKGCLLVLHDTPTSATRAQRREQQEWECFEEERRLRLMAKSAKQT